MSAAGTQPSQTGLRAQNSNVNNEESNNQLQVVQELKKTNEMLVQLFDEVKITVHRVEVLEEKKSFSMSSSSSSPSRTSFQKSVPLNIRVGGHVFVDFQCDYSMYCNIM